MHRCESCMNMYDEKSGACPVCEYRQSMRTGAEGVPAPSEVKKRKKLFHTEKTIKRIIAAFLVFLAVCSGLLFVYNAFEPPEEVYNVNSEHQGYAKRESVIKKIKKGKDIDTIIIENKSLMKNNSDQSAKIIQSVNISKYSVGNIVMFGKYPQRLIKDKELIEELNKLKKDWKSLGYYSGEDLNGDGFGDPGTMKSKDYTKYADVSYKGDKYRAVIFTDYRPFCSSGVCDSGNSNQESNEYVANTVYWFRYEPLEWRVLDPSEGLVVCRDIIDAQPFSNLCYEDMSGNYYNDEELSVYACDYETSSIRSWLHTDFYETAFTDSEKSQIAVSKLENKSYSKKYSKYDGSETEDLVFLLSYSDICSKLYGFNTESGAADSARRRRGTDYAVCQGLFVDPNDGYSHWWLRSPGNGSRRACRVWSDGVAHSVCRVDYTYFGVCPAFRFVPEYELYGSN
ncbi:MAG: DUF6273 domain-containing protein [Clostridiales bacterium]|nr:DUF6273 domain-containing protein [Clostridiales bacterium]